MNHTAGRWFEIRTSLRPRELHKYVARWLLASCHGYPRAVVWPSRFALLLCSSFDNLSRGGVGKSGGVKALSFFPFPLPLLYPPLLLFFSSALPLQVPRLVLDLEMFMKHPVSSEQAKASVRQLDRCGERYDRRGVGWRGGCGAERRPRMTHCCWCAACSFSFSGWCRQLQGCFFGGSLPLPSVLCPAAAEQSVRVHAWALGDCRSIPRPLLCDGTCAVSCSEARRE